MNLLIYNIDDRYFGGHILLVFIQYEKILTKDISTVLTRLLWKGYCNKAKSKIDARFAICKCIKYKVLGNWGHYCRNVRRECEKLTSTLLWISFRNLVMALCI